MAKLRSTNTDVEGFLDNLDAARRGWDRGLRNAVVLGAGGAARAVVYGLVLRGVARIAVVNRTAGRAEVLRQRFGKGCMRRDGTSARRSSPMPGSWSTQQRSAWTISPGSRSTLGGCPGMPSLPTSSMCRCARRSLRTAQARGLRIADGLGMLLHQAVRGFALWFGKTPEVTAELRALVEADLARRQTAGISRYPGVLRFVRRGVGRRAGGNLGGR